MAAASMAAGAAGGWHGGGWRGGGWRGVARRLAWGRGGWAGRAILGGFQERCWRRPTLMAVMGPTAMAAMAVCTSYAPIYDAYGNYLGQQLVNGC